MDDLQQQQVMGALGYPVMALPQTVQPVTNTKKTVQRTQYDPNKLSAVLAALKKPRALKTRGEVIAEALANVPEARSFTGGFGEEIINPWSMALSSFARGFGNAYKSKKEDERERAKEEREDALKAAQLELEATKQAIADETENTHIKYNDPNSKQLQEMQEQMKNMNTLNMLSNQLEEIGTRFDDDFKNIDEMQEGSTRLGRSIIGAGYGLRTSTSEKLARDQFEAWKGSMKNVLVNANRQAGSGSMSDADAARYEQNIGQTKTPAEARNILRSFESRLMMTPLPTQDSQKIKENQAMQMFMKGTI